MLFVGVGSRSLAIQSAATATRAAGVPAKVRLPDAPRTDRQIGPARPHQMGEDRQDEGEQAPIELDDGRSPSRSSRRRRIRSADARRPA